MLPSKGSGLWPTGEPHIIAEPHDAITVAHSLKESKLYSKIVERRKSIDLLTRRMGASFHKNKLEAKLYIDTRMMMAARQVHPDRDPVDLLGRTIGFVASNCSQRSHLVGIIINASDIQYSPDGTCAYVALEYHAGRRLPKILRVVLMAEMIWCIDDALVELDITDGVYR